MENIPLDAIIDIGGKRFKQEPEGKKVSNGALVLDLLEGTYGRAFHSTSNTISVEDRGIIDIGVPLSRVRELIPVDKFY